MLLRRQVIVLALTAGLLPVAGADSHAIQPTLFSSERLVVVTASGREQSFRVEMAITAEQQERGLMHRTSMAEDAGMLFVYRRPSPASFWMRNTLIPLDIIYIGQDGRILNIANAKPLDETPLPAKGLVVGVLEINGGLAAKLGIAPGDRVRHPSMVFSP
jgi:uncharacterized protein